MVDAPLNIHLIIKTPHISTLISYDMLTSMLSKSYEKRGITFEDWVPVSSSLHNLKLGLSLIIAIGYPSLLSLPLFSCSVCFHLILEHFGLLHFSSLLRLSSIRSLFVKHRRLLIHFPEASLHPRLCLY